MMTGARQPSVRRFALHYVWMFATRAALRSERWTPAQRVASIVPFGSLVGLVRLVPELFWILTGRGRSVRHALGFGGVIVVVATGGDRLVKRLIAEAQPEFERIRAEGPPPRR